MRRIVGLVLGIVAIVNGLGIIVSSDCKTVSFGAQGGGRVMVATCFGDDSGALPGPVAGLGMVLLGGAIIFFSVYLNAAKTIGSGVLKRKALAQINPRNSGLEEIVERRHLGDSALNRNDVEASHQFGDPWRIEKPPISESSQTSSSSPKEQRKSEWERQKYRDPWALSSEKATQHGRFDVLYDVTDWDGKTLTQLVAALKAAKVDFEIEGSEVAVDESNELFVDSLILEITGSSPGKSSPDQSQMSPVTAQVSVEVPMAMVDQLGLLLAFGGFDRVNMPTVVQLVSDAQGGGMLSSREQVAAAQRSPSPAQQEKMADIARSVLEGLEAAEGNKTFEAFVHGILVRGLWDLLKMTADAVTEAHTQLSKAMLEAASRLQQLGRQQDAFAVLVAGQVLYVNLASWLQSKT
jgi:hypothetical protein